MGALLWTLFGAVFNPLLTTGPDAVAINPAQLGLAPRPGFACRVLDIEAGFENNSFSFSQYNRYTGAYLDERAKQDILSSIPASGLAIAGRGRAAAAEFGYGQFAVSARTAADADVNLPRDLFDLALYGNRLGRVYTADRTGGHAQVLFRAGAAAGLAVGPDLTFGLAVHCLRGLFRAELVEASARFVTTPQALAADGFASYRRATGGSGWAADAGATWKRGGWLLSGAVLDLSPGIEWNEGVEAGAYRFRLDSTNAYQLLREEPFSDGFERGPADLFYSYLPMRIMLGVGRRVTERLNCALLIQPAWQLDPLLLDDWQSRLVIEGWPLAWLPVGVEVSCGRSRGWALGLQAAALMRGFAVELGLTDVGGIFGSARGLGVRLGVGYGTGHGEVTRTEPPAFKF